ncbi:uncharacterized protein LOC134779016 isoform X1 [Penaeus indicus]|uniref:uncharacterized protein LOC134779016 isoform X1 n=2 Tax=Penaeus indicus TaxID=29960 RepID=UPI00300CBEBF
MPRFRQLLQHERGNTMASGNSSGIGSSLFRGALHGNTSNTNNQSGHQVNTSHHHHHPQQQQHHHHHSVTLHSQQGVGVSAQGSHQGQSQPPPPPQPQPQASMGSSSFSSEEPRQARGTPGVRESPDHMSTLMAKLWFDHNVESSLSSLKKEEHEKRTKDLRKQLEYIADTNWKYLPVEKYIGQQ